MAQQVSSRMKWNERERACGLAVWWWWKRREREAPKVCCTFSSLDFILANHRFSSKMMTNQIATNEELISLAHGVCEGKGIVAATRMPLPGHPKSGCSFQLVLLVAYSKVGRYVQAVYRPAVLEYLIAEGLEVAGTLPGTTKRHIPFPSASSFLYVMTRNSTVPAGGG